LTSSFLLASPMSRCTVNLRLPLFSTWRSVAALLPPPADGSFCETLISTCWMTSLACQ
jgi:hypothetical protein